MLLHCWYCCMKVASDLPKPAHKIDGAILQRKNRAYHHQSLDISIFFSIEIECKVGEI